MVPRALPRRGTALPLAVAVPCSAYTPHARYLSTCVLSHTQAYSYDYLHLNRCGYARYAKCLSAVLKPVTDTC